MNKESSQIGDERQVTLDGVTAELMYAGPIGWLSMAPPIVVAALAPRGDHVRLGTLVIDDEVDGLHFDVIHHNGKPLDIAPELWPIKTRESLLSAMAKRFEGHHVALYVLDSVRWAG